MMSHCGERYASLGVELEMPTAHVQTGQTFPVKTFFRELQKLRAGRGQAGQLLQSQGRDYGLSGERGLNSLDNGYNNLESSLGPIPGSPTALQTLAEWIRGDLQDVADALARESAMVINFSEHPFTEVDKAFYDAVRAPRTTYDYTVGYRGWNHSAGFDAKAHNSPCTGVSLDQAIPALNCLLGLSAVFIAIYANSPFEAGRISPYKENRLTLWPRLMDGSHMPGDIKLYQPPSRPFRHLADYLNWMFGPDTRMWFVTNRSSYKNPSAMYLISDDPPLLDFLRGGPKRAKPFGGGPSTMVTPNIDHLVFHQIAQYSDCRLRYDLLDPRPELEHFLAVLDERPDELEAMLAPYIRSCYLEGRASGANFSDRELNHLDHSDIPASVTVSASALQTGLLQNLKHTRHLLNRYAWRDLIGLRQEAMRHALDAQWGGIRLHRLAFEVLEIAGAGLSAEQTWMLAYPQWVLQTGKTGADRALQRFHQMPGIPADRFWKLILERKMMPA